MDIRGLFPLVAVDISGRNVVVTDCSSSGGRGHIYCFDLNTQDLRWSSPIRGTKMSIGRARGSVSVHAKGSRILVFVAGPTDQYIEIFDAANGECLVRFTSSLGIKRMDD